MEGREAGEGMERVMDKIGGGVLKWTPHGHTEAGPDKRGVWAAQSSCRSVCFEKPRFASSWGPRR